MAEANDAPESVDVSVQVVGDSTCYTVRFGRSLHGVAAATREWDSPDVLQLITLKIRDIIGDRPINWVVAA